MFEICSELSRQNLIWLHRTGPNKEVSFLVPPNCQKLLGVLPAQVWKNVYAKIVRKGLNNLNEQSILEVVGRISAMSNFNFPPAHLIPAKRELTSESKDFNDLTSYAATAAFWNQDECRSSMLGISAMHVQPINRSCATKATEWARATSP